MIFYTGHGTKEEGFEGAWKTYLKELNLSLEDTFITLEEILEVIKASGFQK